MRGGPIGRGPVRGGERERERGWEPVGVAGAGASDARGAAEGAAGGRKRKEDGGREGGREGVVKRKRVEERVDAEMAELEALEARFDAAWAKRKGGDTNGR